MGDASGTRKRRKGGRVTRICEGYDVREIVSPYCMLSHWKLQCDYFHNRPPSLGCHLSLFAFPIPVLQALEATRPRSQVSRVEAKVLTREKGAPFQIPHTKSPCQHEK